MNKKLKKTNEIASKKLKITQCATGEFFFSRIWVAQSPRGQKKYPHLLTEVLRKSSKISNSLKEGGNSVELLFNSLMNQLYLLIWERNNGKKGKDLYSFHERKYMELLFFQLLINITFFHTPRHYLAHYRILRVILLYLDYE